MDVFDAMLTRRSIRKYTDEAVSEQDVQRILDASMMAPSAGNAQPWQFVVVRDREKLNRAGDIHPYASMAKKAPLGILVCGDLSLEKYQGFWVQDCSAAVQNMLLAIHGLGLGGVWTGIYPLDDRVGGFRELLDLPERIVPLAFVVIGHPAQRLKSGRRYKPERVHYEHW